MEKSLIGIPMIKFFKDSYKIILTNPEALQYNSIILKIAETFKEMSRKAKKLDSKSEVTKTPFEHYLKYNKENALKIQYLLENLIAYAPQIEVHRLQN